ncbi:MAG TPA: L,D-transpeptidase [Gemmatimonadaceae bacterium]|nr:L,D-transpeptidase [Gemmatimonadaceae bacterium]
MSFGLSARSKRLGALLVLAPVVPAILWWSPLKGSTTDAPPLRLVVDLSSRQLQVIQNGHLARTYGVAVGRPGHPTPQGSFRTGNIDWNPAWVPPDVDWAKNKKPQPPGAPSNPIQGVKIYFKAPDYYIHGTNNPGSIGEAASHGCIRMTESDAKSLARLIQSSGGSVPLLIKS